MAPTAVQVTWSVEDASLAALAGGITFTPVAVLTEGAAAVPVTITDSAAMLVIEPAGVTRQLSAGVVELVPNDAGGLSPAGWLYQVSVQISGVAPSSFTCNIPYGTGTVDLSELAPTTGGVLAQAAFLPLPGGTMSGPIAMGGNKITGGAPGTAATDFATLGQIPSSSLPLSLLVPAYEYPTLGTFWAQLDAAPVKYLVANVSSGPGSTVNSDYVTAIDAAVAAGVTVLGYVDTAGGTVPSGTVAANVALWKSLYGVAGVFLDNASTSSGELAYYTTVTSAIRAANPGHVLVLNHGAIPASGYAPLADILVVFENAESAWSAFAPASWFTGYPASKFAALITGATGTALMASLMAQARADGIGNIYVTDQTGGNPYSVLAAYWTAEVADAAASTGAYLPLEYSPGAVSGYVWTTDASGNGSWQAAAGGGGSGTVTSVTVESANGLAGTVAGSTAAAQVTLSTTVTGVLKGNGTAISAATAGTDYLAPSGSGAALTGITAAQVGADASGTAATEASRAEAAEALLAPKASPALTGSPTAPTQTTGDATTKIATDAFVATAIAVETSRAEAAEALLAPLASPALTGTPTAPTKTALTSNTDLATTAYADSAVGVETTRAEAAEVLLAPKASPALTGTPSAPTATALTSTTQLATTAFTTGAVATETTRAEGAESTNATAVTTETTRAEAAEALLATLASPAFTGTPTAPTKAALTSNTDIATTAYADSAVTVETSRATTAEALLAPKASPALTGSPTAPTQAGSDNSTKLATTAFVAAALPAALPPNGAASGDLSGSYPSPVIAANAVTNAKAAQMAAGTIKGNSTASTANAADLTVTQVQAMLSGRAYALALNYAMP